MKRAIWPIVLLLVFGLGMVVYAEALKEDKAGYLIISNNICIIVRAPAKQLTASVGRSDLGVVLKDKVTHVSIHGGYMAIMVQPAKIDATIKRFRLQNLTMVE